VEARVKRWLGWLAVAGNIVFILWITFNAIDEGFRGTPPQVVSWIALAALLVLDTLLILRGRD